MFSIIPLIASVALFFLYQVPEEPEFTPGDGSIIAEKNPVIAIRWRSLRFGRWDLASLSLDNKNVTDAVETGSDSIILELDDELSDGNHYLSAEMKYKFLVTRTVRLKWMFGVDTKKPYIELGANGVLGCRESKTEISGLTEPGSQLKVKFNGKKLDDPSVYGGGTFFLPLRLNPFDNTLELEAIDKAGNKAKKRIKVVVDKVPPMITGYSPVVKKKIKKSVPIIEAAVEEGESEISEVCFKINGLKVRGNYDHISHRAQPDLVELAEGINQIEVEAKDTAGNRAKTDWSFVVDSTEEFGTRTMAEGAVGADVRELQARLRMHGFNSGRVSGLYNSHLTEAVRSLQNNHGIPQSGVIGPEELRILKPKKLNTDQPVSSARIVIEISRRALQLYSRDDLVKVYPIAVGRGGRFRTPIGKHRIRKKIVNPTWYPPEWAGLDHPIRPGPNNPLGNREMKLSKRSYSIHGTSRPMSIGSAATHGCIRMYPSDILELFAVVGVGTPVEIKR